VEHRHQTFHLIHAEVLEKLQRIVDIMFTLIYEDDNDGDEDGGEDGDLVPWSPKTLLEGIIVEPSDFVFVLHGLDDEVPGSNAATSCDTSYTVSDFMTKYRRSGYGARVLQELINALAEIHTMRINRKYKTKGARNYSPLIVEEKT
jgi:hypothetical protein